MKVTLFIVAMALDGTVWERRQPEIFPDQEMCYKFTQTEKAQERITKYIDDYPLVKFECR